MSKKREKKPRLPVDIKLPERVLLDDGVMFIVLRTLKEFEQFWIEHKGQFKFACQGHAMSDGQTFMREYDWVFGNSKSALVKTVMRWGQSGIGCEFYDWAKYDPEMYEGWFHSRATDRALQIEHGQWSDKDEIEYMSRSRESYRGWWRFCNLPNCWLESEWFNPCIDHEELVDPAMPLSDVADKLFEQSFDDWRRSSVEELEAHDQQSIEKMWPSPSMTDTFDRYDVTIGGITWHVNDVCFLKSLSAKQ